MKRISHVIDILCIVRSDPRYRTDCRVSFAQILRSVSASVSAMLKRPSMTAHDRHESGYNPLATVAVYELIHRIRRDIIHLIDTPLSMDQVIVSPIGTF